jgi:hypothetical protein
MNYYDIWVDLRDSRQDLAFARAVDAYLSHLRGQGKLESFTLARRKFGFGPDGLGEFHIRIAFRDLAQLDACFSVVATREGEVERLHHPVYSMVTNFRSALFRDFPDPERAAASAPGNA